jgi:hypothetical protein
MHRLLAPDRARRHVAAGIGITDSGGSLLTIAVPTTVIADAARHPGRAAGPTSCTLILRTVVSVSVGVTGEITVSP